MNEEIKKIFEDIINVKNTEVTKENANMSMKKDIYIFMI